jgi:hypothetical protein
MLHAPSLPPSPPAAAATAGPAAWRSRAGLALLAVSLVACALAPLTSSSPFADLSGCYTDHLRHAHLTWLFLHEGMDIYRLPYAKVAALVPWPHPIGNMWGAVPYAYPPGALAFFLPYALVGHLVPMSTADFARVGVLYILVWSHLALWAVGRALGPRPGPLGWAALAVAWLMFVRCALQGFYDPAWVFFAALAVERLRKGRAESALVWCALAALMSYRAMVLAPLALGAVWLSVRGRPAREWPWGRLALLAGVGVVCLLLFVPVLRAERSFRQELPLWGRGGQPYHLVLGATLVAAGLAAWRRDVWLTGSVLVSALLALVDTRQWWHAVVLLVPVVAVGAARQVSPGGRALVQAAMLAWLLVLHRNAWGGPPSRLFNEVKHLTWREWRWAQGGTGPQPASAEPLVVAGR